MTFAEGAIIGGLVLTMLGIIIEAIRRFYIQIQELAANKEASHARIYERLDETKIKADEKFASKEVCQIMHKQISDALSDIKTDVKLLLKKNNE